jgi:hypothetical protein
MRLRKSLYGLHESAKLWHETMCNTLRQLGYIPCDAQEVIWLHPETGVIMLLYVDDNLHTGTSDGSKLDCAITELGNIFKLRDLGFPQSFLGMEVTKGGDGSITLTQAGYTQRILREHGMEDAHGADTPAAGPIINDGESPPLSADMARHYSTLLGELGWLARCTRPDIAFAVSRLQRFTAAPRWCHQEAAKRVLRYLKQHAGGVAYRRLPEGEQLELIGYADASFAADQETRRSHTGYTFLLAGAAVEWRSRQQSLVTLSTAEAEYVALCSASKDAVALSRLLQFLGFGVAPITLLEDNSAAIRLAQDPGASKRTKHIDVQFHYVREQVQAGHVRVTAVSTHSQHADVLTKALPANKHHFHAAVLMGSG